MTGLAVHETDSYTNRYINEACLLCIIMTCVTIIIMVSQTDFLEEKSLSFPF